MEYEIVKKEQFTVVGVARKFNKATSYAEIPKFWTEHLSGELAEEICGTYGVCVDEGENGEFIYYIADDYVPWVEYPKFVETRVIPAHAWAVFPCDGALPQALQKLNDEIWSKWLPSNGKYRLVDNLDIEFYIPPCDNSDEEYCEIWLPVEEI